MIPQALAPEAAADERRRHADLSRLQVEHVGDRLRLGRHELAGVVDDQFVADPRDRRSMRLDRVVVVTRRAIDVIDLVRRRRQHRIRIADLVQQRLTHEQARLRTLRPGRSERGDGRFHRIGRDDQRLRVIGLLLRLGEHDRDRLAVPVDSVVLHDRQVRRPRRGRRRTEHRRRVHPWRVQVSHHRHDARRSLGRRGIDRRDPPARNSRIGERGVDHALQRKLGREGCRAAHLQRTIEPRHRRPDQPMLLADQRIGHPARDPAVGGERYQLAHCALQ